MIIAWESDNDVCKFLFSYLFILTSVLTLHRGAQLVTSRGQLGLKVQHSVENSVSRILALTSHFRPSVHKRDILPFLHFMTLEVLGPFGARLLGSGLWACLTSSFTPLGRSCRVTHSTVQWLDSALEKSQRNPKTIANKSKILPKIRNVSENPKCFQFSRYQSFWHQRIYS